ncbi:MAG: anthranilate synthase component II [Candidatus Dormibacteria bacterium]
MILVVDHQDSFVYNLVQFVGAAGYEVRVVPSTGTTPAEVIAMRPAGVILSPGPGRPEDAGCFVELIRRLPEEMPLLGVCLGHQALAAAYGARTVRAPEPVHGKVSAVAHQGTGLFRGLPSPLEVGRYHSLVVDPGTLPDGLTVVAQTEDGLVMALVHERLPRYGLQFHPESVLTPRGPDLLRAFLGLVGAP